MAQELGWLQRSIKTLSAHLKALSSGDGESPAARLGRSFQKAAAQSLGALKSALRMKSAGDTFEVTSKKVDRQRRAQRLIGGDVLEFVPKDAMRGRDLRATVQAEFRGQVAAGLAAASSRAVGSSLMDAPLLGEDGAR